jgi:hypothetical protein
MRLGPRVFAFLAATYLLSLGGHVYSGDELMMARVTEAMVTRGEVSVRPIANFEDYAAVQGPDGRTYTWFGFGLSLAAVPFYVAGMAVEHLVPPSAPAAFAAPKVLYYDRDDVSELVRMLAITCVNPLVTALTALVILAILARLGMSRRAAAACALAYGVTGVTWFYAKTFFSEPLAGLGLAASLWAWLRMRGSAGRAPGWAFLAGAAAGASVLARVANGVVLVPAFAAFAWDAFRSARASAPGAWRRVMARVTAAACGAVVPIAVLAAYNAAKFGTPLETGYSGVLGLFGGDVLDGLFGLSFSPGRGAVWYFPWVLFAVPGLFVLGRRDGPAALVVGGSAVGVWGVYSLWGVWEGGWVFGPRFLVPVFPLLAVPAALLVSARWHVRAFRAAVIVVGAASFALAVQSIQVNFIDYTYAAWRLAPDIHQAIRWSWEWSPLVRYWDFPEKGFLIGPALLAGQAGTFLAVAAWSLVAAWVASAVALAVGLTRREA